MKDKAHENTDTTKPREMNETVPIDAPTELPEHFKEWIELWYGRTTDLGHIPSPYARIYANKGPWGPGGQGADLDEVDKEGW